MFLLSVTATAAGLLSSCNEQETPAPDRLKNAIEYGTERTAVNTVLYRETDDGGYDIYLSPRRGVKYIENMVAVDDYLQLTTTSADGAAGSDDKWSLKYRSINVDSETPGTVTAVIYALISKTEGTLDLNISVTQAGETVLNAVYDGVAVMAGEKPLANQWRAGTEISPIGSVVKYMDIAGSIYYIYDLPEQTGAPGSGYSGKYIEIEVPEGLDVSDGIEIEEISGSKPSIRIDGKDIIGGPEEAAGRFRITEDKSGKDITVSFAIVAEGQRYEAEYFGMFTPTYPQDNYLKISEQDGTVVDEAVPLTRVLAYKLGSSYHIAAGTSGNPADPASLQRGMHAFDLSITNINMKMNEAGTGTGFSMNLCDNTVPEIIPLSGEGASGHVYSASDPQGRENWIYLNADVTFPGGKKVECQWYGEITVLETDFVTGDLLAQAPVGEPGSGNIVIYESDGTTIKEALPVKEVQLRQTTRETVSGIAGSYDFYYFYFINSESDADPDHKEGYPTPKLRILQERVNSGRHNVPDAEFGPWWQLTYRDCGRYGLGITQSQIYAGHQLLSPVAGSYEIELDQDTGRCKISFRIHDQYDASTYAGSGEWIELEYEGPLSDYTGSL